jgi:hypothetical protein
MTTMATAEKVQKSKAASLSVIVSFKHVIPKRTVKRGVILDVMETRVSGKYLSAINWIMREIVP